MKYSSFFYIKVFLFISLVLFATFSLTQLSAQVTITPIAGFGLNCTQNYADCPQGQSHLGKGEGIEVFGDSSNSIFLGELSKQYASVANNACYNPSNFSGKIITRYDKDAHGYKDFSYGDKAFRVCYGGLIPMKTNTPSLVGGGDYINWGCCPPGYTPATNSDYLGASIEGLDKSMICCYNPGGTYYVWNNGDRCSYESAPGTGTLFSIPPGSHSLDTKIFNISNEKNKEFENKTIKEVLLSDNPQIQSFATVFGTSIPFNVEFDPNKVPEEFKKYAVVESNGKFRIPIQGLVIDLNPSKLTAGLEVVANNGSINVCAEKNGCTLLQDGNVVKSSDLYNSNNLTCQKCYGQNDVIGFDPADSNKVIICDTTQPGNVSRSEAVAGNPVSTKACLTAGTPGSEQYKACQKCTELGGIWIALGCFDPSPIGVITGIIRITFGIVGGVSLILIIRAGLMYMNGNEGDIKKAREQLISIFQGLVIIIFSIVILRVLGINILDVLPQGSI
jgi:hypothetical protein